MENNDKELEVARASDGKLYVSLEDYLKLKFEFEKLKVLLQEKELENK